MLKLLQCIIFVVYGVECGWDCISWK